MSMSEIHTPYVSLIMPIRNEFDYIESGLKAILDQDYPLNKMEILIVDGMSTDGSREIIHEFCTCYPQLDIQILDNPKKIVATGMNIALQQIKGDIVIRVDGHCIIASDYVRICVENINNEYENMFIDGVGGYIETIGVTYTAMVIAIGMGSVFGVGNSAFRTSSGQSRLTDTVPFPAYTRKIIEKIGFYDEELVRDQDDEYNYRIREAGGKILLVDEISSKYFSRASLKKLWMQYFQYGFWKIRVLQKHPRQMSIRQFIPPMFVLALLLTFIIYFINPFLAYIIPLTYLSVNLIASVWISLKKGLQYLLLLPLVFLILHISYGTGFLFGLFKFWNRWGDKVGKVPSL